MIKSVPVTFLIAKLIDLSLFLNLMCYRAMGPFLMSVGFLRRFRVYGEATELNLSTNGIRQMVDCLIVFQFLLLNLSMCWYVPYSS